MTIPIICGTTSSGKSAYAFNLAKKYHHCNILSVDSRQFYKDIPIVSGQDTPPKNVTIFGQGILEPDQISNLADFQKYAWRVIDQSTSSNTPLIIVGGTGLYLKAIATNLSTSYIPPDPNLRAEAEKMSVLDLQNLLKKINLEKFNSLNNSDRNNPRRLIRYTEISYYHKLHPSVIASAARQSIIINTSFNWYGLKKSPDQLAKDIKTRVVSRLDQGAIEEVKLLLKNYPDQKLPIYTALGVKQIIEYLDGKIDKENLIKNWTQTEVSYAKRQTTWFKKQPGIIWYDSN